MAVTATTVNSELCMVMDNGTGASGQQLSKNRSYKDVKIAAADEDIYSIAQSLNGLQDKSLLAVQRKNIIELEEEA